MSQSRKVILAIAALFFVMSILFVPSTVPSTGYAFDRPPRAPREGYYLVWSSAVAQNGVNGGKLAMEWVLLAMVTGAAYWVAGDQKKGG